ncbi:MAG TPA: bifunctional adenosylcobinamide kinase/adenosylcobinamide-phosphate guanylyltransferase [Dehalococcoidia bacterium]|jgi:adenosylcobinamide kinase/adenosylcobinamide-phosphate guanylyltransferase|nr:bifunctional adenosylcobinamide kinase/adenosylcobinamide-phosphate guanylyltransferase [Dehalococcoidia bacterium]
MASLFTLVLGGVRSGKSAFAEGLAGKDNRPVLYLATGLAVDEEMEERIRRHQESRPAHWTTIEEPLDLAGSLTTGPLVGVEGPVLIDSLDVWLANMMFEQKYSDTEELENSVLWHINGMLKAIDQATAEFTLVSSEVGLSMVPMELMGRRFQDLLGMVNQRVAAKADRVYTVMAGIPVQIKGPQSQGSIEN